MSVIKRYRDYLNDEFPFQVFVDMDGVIANFDKRFKDLDKNVDNLSFYKFKEKYGKELGWKIIDEKGIKWWSHMEWMPDGKELWEYLKPYNPIILSSPSRSSVCVSGKAIWCKRELGFKQELPTISPKNHRWDENSRMIINTQKYLFSNRYENSILIDDTKKKINNWTEKGSIGILHKNTENTIKEFEKIILNLK